VVYCAVLACTCTVTEKVGCALNVRNGANSSAKERTPGGGAKIMQADKARERGTRRISKVKYTVQHQWLAIAVALFVRAAHAGHHF